jgi:hypothetical protein
MDKIIEDIFNYVLKEYGTLGILIFLFIVFIYVIFMIRKFNREDIYKKQLIEKTKKEIEALDENIKLTRSQNIKKSNRYSNASRNGANTSNKKNIVKWITTWTL